MDEIALQRAVQKADKTQRVIDAHKEVWDELDADIWRMWRATKSADKDTREDLYREHHGIQAVQARLQRVVNEGKRAEEELRQRDAALPEELKRGN